MKNLEFSTTDINLAAAIMTATGRHPEIYRQPGHSLVAFEFPDDQPTRNIIFVYAGGELSLPVKQFAACRSALYREARRVQQ